MVQASCGSASWWAERLIDTRGTRPGDSPAHRVTSVHAVRSTQVPISSISPVSSATGMKTLGAIRPWVGWSHRIRASAPTSSPVPRSTRIGPHEEVEEVEELLVAVASRGLIGHLPGHDLEGGEQARRAVALVVVGMTLDLA